MKTDQKKVNFNEETKDIWSSYYGREISDQEASDIKKNILDLVNLLKLMTLGDK